MGNSKIYRYYIVLYSAIINKDGTVNKGFQGVGRKLNPTLSLPSVKERIDNILGNGFKFNSWFIDCDATGEIFDDYAKSRMTTQSQDVEARLQRMEWIRDCKTNGYRVRGRK